MDALLIKPLHVVHMSLAKWLLKSTAVVDRCSLHINGLCMEVAHDRLY